jgi:phage recombination protein Bet
MTKETAVQIKSDNQEIAITFNDVRKYLCSDASDAEIGLFLRVCQSEGLNPFRKDCFLVKYTQDQPAAIIISTDIFLRAAENSPEFNGYQAGIILKPIDPKDKPEFREGSFLLDGEEGKLAGGWARVYRKDKEHPFYAAVNIKECIKYTRAGKPTRFWENMPATMVRKVALSRALREAFSNRYSGTYTTAEIEPPPEGELPAAFQNENGDTKWKLFWAKMKERGLSPDDVHKMLRITSLKDDWLEKGKTLENASRIIDEMLLQFPPKTESEIEPVPPWAGKPEEDPVIANFGELYTVCLQEFGLSRQQVWAELNANSQIDLTETPSECYRKIKAARE